MEKKIFLKYINGKRLFCLQQELTPFCALFALLMNSLLPTWIWLWCARRDSITGHDIKMNNTGFPLCLNSYHILQDEIKFTSPNLRCNKAHGSAAPIQHCENCIDISSHYTLTRVLLDNNLLIKQQSLTKPKKLICVFYSRTLPSMRFCSNKNASGNAVLQNFKVSTYNKSILVTTTNPIKIIPHWMYSTLNNRSKPAHLGQNPVIQKGDTQTQFYNFHTLTKSIDKHCTFKHNTWHIRITCNNINAKAFVKYSHEI